jgi:hypothetical protein
MYTIVLKDREGYEITRTSEDNLKDARKAAVYFLTSVYATRMGTTHEALGTHKVEVLKNDECVWDKFI